MALAENTNLPFVVGDNAIPAAADAVGYKGSMISISETSGEEGYGHALVAGELFAGHALDDFDNTDGDDGDINIQVRANRYRLLVTLTDVAITNIGDNVYASDDGTYTLTAGSNTLVGYVSRYVGADSCEVQFVPFVTA